MNFLFALFHHKAKTFFRKNRLIKSNVQRASYKMSTRTASTFRQLFEHLSSTYTYILACPATKQAVIIDPVLETVDRDIQVVKHMGVELKYAINTHCHADHVTGTGELRKRLPKLQTGIGKASGANADFHFAHGDQIKFGNCQIEVRSTPGHTDGCCTFVYHEHRMAFTGDALLINGCGRTDFQQGDPGTLYDSNWKWILSLPDDFALYPAHDYKGLMVTTVGEQKKYNPRLTKTKDEFIKIMDNLGLAYPKQIDKSVPANLVCGVYDVMDDKTKAQVKEAIEKLSKI